MSQVPTQSEGMKSFVHQNSDEVLTMSERNTKRIDVEQLESLDVTEQPNRCTLKTIPNSPKKALPVFMIVISLIQALIFYCLGSVDSLLYFCYDPHRRHEVHRFLTIMFTHITEGHLVGNLFVQLILGVPLETIYHWKRIGLIYTGGVLGGTLFISVLTPMEYAAGSSGGMYALLFAHVAAILLNWNQMDKKCCRLFWIITYIALDVALAIVAMYKEPNLKSINVNHAGHLGGALIGFLLSIIVLKNFKEHCWEKSLQRVCGKIFFNSALIIVNINIGFPSMYSQSEFNTDYMATYLIRVYKTIDTNPTLLTECLEHDVCTNDWIEYKTTGKVTP